LRRILASRAAPLLGTTLLTAVGVVLVTWPLTPAMGRATLRDGEVLLTAWQLNWFHHALLTDPASWIDANIFFPYDHATTFNDLLLSHAILTLPVAAAESPVLALNLALLGGIVPSGLFANLLLDELVDAPWAAAAGGTLFALAPFRFLHMGHLSVAAAWTVPMFFWALLRHLRQPSWAWAALAAASGVAVGLSSDGPADVEYWHREWRALRYMLASKQHGQHLVNGTGRIEPFLWYRFRWVEPWSDDFFGDITAYFPVDYVLIHQAGLPDAVREAVSSRLARGTDGWRPLMRSPGVHVYTIDRSFGRGSSVDRLFLRRHLTPRAEVEFSARRAGEAGAASGDAGQTAPTLELLRDREVIDAWPLGAEWREFRASVPVAALATEPGGEWPRTGTLPRWRLRGAPASTFEIRDLSVARDREPLD
jgi:hypothetical protein